MVAVLLVRLFDETAAFLPAATLESFRAELGLTYAQAATVLAMVAPGSLAGTVFSAAADRHSRRAIAAGGAFAFAACMALFAAGDSFLVLAVSAFLMGTAATAMVDAAEVALVDLAGEDLRSYLARGNLLATVGDVLGPALVAAVAVAGLSWRATFWVVAGLLFVYGLALAATPLPAPRLTTAATDSEDGVTERRSSLDVLGAVVRDRRVWAVGLVSLLLVPFDEPFIGFTIALLERERGTSAGVATIAALIGVSGGLVAFTVLARRFRDVPDGRLLAGAATAMTAGAVVTAAVPVVAVVAAGALLTSIGLSLAWLGLQHRMLTLRPGEVGTTKAVITAIEMAGFLVPIGVGAVADHTDLVAAMGVYAVLGVAVTALARTAGGTSRRVPAPPAVPARRD